MRLSHEIVDAIIRERSHKPIVGDVLLIGHQSVALSTSEVLELLREHGIPARGDECAAQQVERTPGQAGPPRIEDGKLLRILGADDVRTLVTTPAERGDITHQLGTPLPERLVGSADFIVDGGSLANRFDPAATIENYAALLRPGGRLIAINTLSNHFDPYTMPSPAWYLDYFVGNGFADCRVYVVVYRLHEPANAFCVDIDCLLDPKREVRNFVSRYEMAVIAFAEKSVESTTHVRPAHAHQRPPLEWDRYRSNLERIKQNPRPHIVRSRGRMNYFDVRGGHLFMRRDYAAVDPSSEERRVRADGGHVAVADTAAAAPAPQARLRILCVGTGRDGTQSLNYMVQRIFDALGGPRSMHEYGCRELYQAFCDLRETGEVGHAAEIERIIADCPWDCIVSNGYAAVLPAFAERYGRGLKVIHLRRADRDACIASLKKNCELFPAAYGY
jgi:SAM-dependent methyltransferase